MSRIKCPVAALADATGHPGCGLPSPSTPQCEPREGAAVPTGGLWAGRRGMTAASQQIVCVEPPERADGRAVAGGLVVARDEVEEPEQLVFPVGADLLA
jgi:hypothetical protein